MAFLFFVSPAAGGRAAQLVQNRGTGRFGDDLLRLASLVGIQIQFRIQQNQPRGFIPQLPLKGKWLAQLCLCRFLLVAGFVQLRLEGFQPLWHLRQSVVQTDQVASGVAAQGSLVP